jgi:hypothetical protein
MGAGVFATAMGVFTTGAGVFTTGAGVLAGPQHFCWTLGEGG